LDADYAQIFDGAAPIAISFTPQSTVTFAAPAPVMGMSKITTPKKLLASVEGTGEWVDYPTLIVKELPKGYEYALFGKGFGRGKDSYAFLVWRSFINDATLIAKVKNMGLLVKEIPLGEAAR